MQCVYNPTVGRERQWGAGTVAQAAEQRRVVVVGAGPAGLEYARIAAARGHVVHVVDRAAQAGGHARAGGRLPGRAEYGRIGTWLAEQAEGNGATLRLGEEATLGGARACWRRTTTTTSSSPPAPATAPTAGRARPPALPAGRPATASRGTTVATASRRPRAACSWSTTCRTSPAR